MDLSLSLFPLVDTCCYMLILVDFVCLTAHITSCGTFMASHRWNRVLTHYNIFVGFYCLTAGIELPLATAYIWVMQPYLCFCCLMLAFAFYFGCHYLIMALIAFFRLSLPHFGWLLPYLDCYHAFYWPLSLMILLSGSYDSDTSVMIMEFDFLLPVYAAIWHLITFLDYGTRFFMSNYMIGTW